MYKNVLLLVLISASLCGGTQLQDRSAGQETVKKQSTHFKDAKVEKGFSWNNIDWIDELLGRGWQLGMIYVVVTIMADIASNFLAEKTT